MTRKLALYWSLNKFSFHWKLSCKIMPCCQLPDHISLRMISTYQPAQVIRFGSRFATVSRHKIWLWGIPILKVLLRGSLLILLCAAGDPWGRWCNQMFLTGTDLFTLATEIFLLATKSENLRVSCPQGFVLKVKPCVMWSLFETYCNPFKPKSDLIDFTLSNARWFYSSNGDPLGVKGLIKVHLSSQQNVNWIKNSSSLPLVVPN